MSTLTKASRQWSSRPADERFSSLADLHAACVLDAQVASTTRALQTSELRVIPVPETGELKLNGATGAKAKFTHWAFGQLCRLVQAPADYLRKLRPEIAASALNSNLDDAGAHQSQLLLAQPDGVGTERTVRAITSPSYSRILNADVTGRLVRLEADGPWQPAPAAFDGSRGLYKGDRDFFGFFVDNTRRIFEKDPNGGLSRGFFVWNSEVGAASFGIETFLYQYVCGNHMVWGASNVKQLRVRHVGNANETAWAGFYGELKRYADQSASEDEARIISAKATYLGADKDAVLDRIFGIKPLAQTLSLKAAGEAYAIAEKHTDWYGDPNTVWGFANGLTQYSQSKVNADDRVAIDRAAGKLLEIAF